LATDCTPAEFEFQGNGRRQVKARFDGGRLCSDGGALLLGQVEAKRGILRRLASCFIDFRDPRLVEHSVEELVRQRVYGIALGYEDLCDHEQLREDPLLATLAGKRDPTGLDRRQPTDRGKPLAGKSTLHRLEWGLAGEAESDRYRRIVLDGEAVDRFFVDVFLDGQQEAPKQLILDLDATDDPIHGSQEGRFFHGYYGGYCYLPLYIFCGTHLLCARLRRSDIDASSGSSVELERIVGQIRERWPEVKILLRADSGFAREELMSWCEQRGVDYVFGLARNPRLEEALAGALDQAFEKCGRSGQPERVYDDFFYRTLDSWSRERRVIGKAEILDRGPNPRFIVTSLSRRKAKAAELYEQIYCARGEMENRIKEQQLYLFADRTSAHLMRVNQIRLWFSSVAYLLLNELRRLGLVGSSFAQARCDTIRTQLLKIGGRITVSVRRIVFSLDSHHPRQAIFAHAYECLQRAGPLVT
jgi:hypothetical protein